MLARRSQWTAWHRKHPFLPKRHNGILVYERVLIRDARVEWYIHTLMILPSLVYVSPVTYLLHIIGLNMFVEYH